MKLILEENGDENFYAEVKDNEEAFELIREYCKKTNFEIHYYRCWQNDNRMYVDFGSHYKFFIIEKD